MKTILISTDFSANGTHAAKYGYELARQIKANVILCNAVVVPAEMPQAGFIAWPMDEYDVLMDGSIKELKYLKQQLEKTNFANGFNPLVRCLNECGTLTDVVNNTIAKYPIDLVIIGTHGNTGLSGFLMGDHSQKMIDGINKPLLLVPPFGIVGGIKKIAFATDFQQPEQDLDCIYSLVRLAKPLNAEILLTHVYNEKDTPQIFQKNIKEFLAEISNKADYPNIYYRIIKNKKTETGLDWLCANGQIDMLAMSHRQHNFFDKLLNGSHTQKMAARIPVPLLVFSEGK